MIVEEMRNGKEWKERTKAECVLGPHHQNIQLGELCLCQLNQTIHGGRTRLDTTLERLGLTTHGTSARCLATGNTKQGTSQILL
jgi:hypothetical protein